MPGAPALTALNAPAATADPTALELRPVQMASVPFNTLSTATLLPAKSQAVGFQMSSRHFGGNRHLTYAIAGAAIGAIAGAIGSDPAGKALIGAAVGFGLSYAVSR